MVTVTTTPDRMQVHPSGATVFIVDDDADVRRSLALLVRSVHLKVETFASAREFLENFDSSRPGCLVLDVRMPDMSGLELQKQLSSRSAGLAIILISGHAEVPMAIEAMRAGALDFLQKPFSPHMLLDRVQEAVKLAVDRRQAQSMHDQLKQRIAALSAREREVMHLLAAGDSTKVIASRLGISPKTVDNHRIKVFEKMGVENAAQLAGFMIRFDSLES